MSLHDTSYITTGIAACGASTRSVHHVLEKLSCADVVDVNPEPGDRDDKLAFRCRMETLLDAVVDEGDESTCYDNTG